MAGWLALLDNFLVKTNQVHVIEAMWVTNKIIAMLNSGEYDSVTVINRDGSTLLVESTRKRPGDFPTYKVTLIEKAETP